MMETFIQAKDYELWNIVIDGKEYPTKKDAKNNNIQKQKSEYDEGDYKILQNNAKAKFILICGIVPDEYLQISSCIIAKQIWDTIGSEHLMKR